MILSFYNLSTLLVIATMSLLPQKKVDVTGTWAMKVETSVGSGSPIFELKHVTESTLVGTYKGQLGEANVAGTLKSNIIHLEFTVSGGKVEYDGTVEADTMKGNVKLGNMGDGTFIGTLKK